MYADCPKFVVKYIAAIYFAKTMKPKLTKKIMSENSFF